MTSPGVGKATAPATGASSALRLPPGPPERRSLVQSLPFFVSMALDAIGTVGRRFERYGDIYYAPSGGTPLYVLRHPDHIHEVLATRAGDYRKQHSALTMLARVLGSGLLTSDGETWQRHRRLLGPAFRRDTMAGYASVFVEEAARVSDGWSDGAVVDVGAAMMELTLRAVCRALFGHDAAGDVGRVDRAMQSFHRAVATPALLPRWLPGSPEQRVAEGVNDLDELVFGLIRSRRAEGRTGPPRDLLDELLVASDDGGKLSEREVRDELVTMFLAGHETTSHALTWTWWLLATHPEEAHALHAELEAVLRGELPRFEHAAELGVCDRTVMEAMRLYPPVYAIARSAHTDTRIGDYDVPADSEVVIWVYWTQRDERWWPASDEFRPERFLPERAAGRPRLAYLPFGAGGRACIGRHFAQLEAQLVVATLAQRWAFEPLPGATPKPKPRITLVPSVSRMRVHQR